ncbi:maleylacetoacetate isomerase [Sphingomonas sp. ASY06-1R]|jgi:maleylpyruvate isomerase|uniref:maleylacetoacetate isomerase n=1 Tax=Sphingomonas sp. ASY06-1R TaxID=3445771 RepID=UPI003FA1E07C
MNELRLHGYWRSSASYRVRIALNLKQLPYRQITHDLRKGEQTEPAYRAIAPAGLVPALEFEGYAFVQSLPILEWLDERWPQPALLPATPEQRALARGMASTLVADVHPLNNLRVLNYLKSDLHQSSEVAAAWMQRWIDEGFAALETMIARYGGTYAFGDQPGIVDCCLVPQVYNAERFGIDIAHFPRLSAATAHARAHPAFAAAHPDLQPDADPA